MDKSMDKSMDKTIDIFFNRPFNINSSTSKFYFEHLPHVMNMITRPKHLSVH